MICAQVSQGVMLYKLHKQANTQHLNTYCTLVVLREVVNALLTLKKFPNWSEPNLLQTSSVFRQPNICILIAANHTRNTTTIKNTTKSFNPRPRILKKNLFSGGARRIARGSRRAYRKQYIIEQARLQNDSQVHKRSYMPSQLPT